MLVPLALPDGAALLEDEVCGAAGLEGVEKGEEVFTRGRPPPVLPKCPPDFVRPVGGENSRIHHLPLHCVQSIRDVPAFELE